MPDLIPQPDLVQAAETQPNPLRRDQEITL